MTEQMEINVKVPNKYAKKKYISAICIGLWNLALGERPDPDEVEIDNMVSVRIKLSPRALSCWDSLLPKYENNQRRLAREALHLVSLEPEHCLKCRF